MLIWCQGGALNACCSLVKASMRTHVCVFTYLCTPKLQYISQKHRSTEWQGLEGISGDHLIQPTCQSRVSQSRLHRTSFREVLNRRRVLLYHRCGNSDPADWETNANFPHKITTEKTGHMLWQVQSSFMEGQWERETGKAALFILQSLLLSLCSHHLCKNLYCQDRRASL